MSLKARATPGSHTVIVETMEIHKPLPSMPHTMIHNEKLDQLEASLRPELLTKPPLLSDNLRSKSDHGYSLPTPDDSPPRLEDKKPLPIPKSETTALTLEETTQLFATRIDDARRDTRKLAGNEEVSEGVIPKLTLDLGNSGISRLPEAVVDLIKDEVERLSLSHNQIWHIPLRFSECSHLRYLNIRSNVFREIPRGVYKLPLLEILDISRNKIRKIPKDIRNLSSLRVFAIVHNRIDDLPTDICELTKLQVLKVAENPLKANLKKVIEAKEADLEHSAFTINEREQMLTTEIKRYLREQHPTATPVEGDFMPVQEDSQLDTPKPARRSLARFPVVPSSASTDASTESTKTSPNQGRPPPIPTRSHHRVVSGQMSAQRRTTGLTPLISSSERNRSNSETGSSFTLASNRQRRMGMLRKEKTDLDAIDETKAFRQSHLRGFSHGSALRRNGSISSPLIGSSSPGSPRIQNGPVMQTIKRLSSLPEGKADSDLKNPVINGAKGILYSFHQIEVQVRGLLSIIQENDVRRNSLELTFYNASKWLKRLNRTLERAISMDAEDTENLDRAQETLQQDCLDCVNAYKHVITQVQDNMKGIMAVTDPMVVRTFMLLLFGSIIEIKNAMRSFGMETRGHKRQMSSGNTHPIQTIPEEFTTPQQPVQAATPSRGRSTARPQGGRLRSETTIQHQTGEVNQNMQSTQPVPSSAIPQMPNSARLPPNFHLVGTMQKDGPPSSASSFTTTSGMTSFGVRSRSNSRTALSSATNSSFSSIANTPRSGEGFQLPPPSTNLHRVNPATGMTDAQEESFFEQIYLALSRSYETALQAIPIAQNKFKRCLEQVEENRQPREFKSIWQSILHRCKICIELSTDLKMQLTGMPHQDSGYGATTVAGGRNDPRFWILCKSFLSSFIELATEMRSAKEYRILPADILVILRPVHKASRDAGRLIENSPWSHLTEGNAATQTVPAFDPNVVSSNPHGGYSNETNAGFSVHPSVYYTRHAYYANPTGQASAVSLPNTSATTSYPVPPNAINAFEGVASSSQLTATPLSAALGPAAQATIPNNSGSAYGDQFFKGDVFQRADVLLSMQQSGTVNFLNRR